MNTSADTKSHNFSVVDTSSHYRMRKLKDTVARHAMAVGGISVIIAILLIFFYLFLVVLPLFESADMDAEHRFALPAKEQGSSMVTGLDEYGEVGFRLTEQGGLLFFSAEDGKTIDQPVLPLPAGVDVVSVAAGEPESQIYALGLSNGSALLLKTRYRISYPNDVRVTTPELEYPLGSDPIVIDDQGKPLSQVAVRIGEEQYTLAGVNSEGRISAVSITREENFMSGEIELSTSTAVIRSSIDKPDYLWLDVSQTQLYLANKDGVAETWLLNGGSAEKIQDVNLLPEGDRLTALSMLNGGISLLAGSDKGAISQWFPVRNADGVPLLTQIRSFKPMEGEIRSIVSEFRRKGFAVADGKGNIAVYHATANTRPLFENISKQALTQVAMSPRGLVLMVQMEDGNVATYSLDNEHPEISWSSLWGEVWYESYPEPDRIWQSSSASNDFEPKFSLAPLAFGTLKAAFYAMLVAVPLAILGAIYTAYFMSPGMRQIVKPGIEVMEALPTVILGFLAGLWLAPFIEDHLPATFSLLIILPIGVMAFGFFWSRLPGSIRFRVPDGWQPALLVPIVVILGWLAFELSQPMETLFFGGDMRQWLTDDLGMDFDQRNSLVVGLAMGFAVIPTIFSITEDAVFSVPKHLTQGSLALGATPWQTLSRVVILTASPGIFSAVMIGLGRAVGETMIVLMATGNTPVMDFSIFQGMRTLSANIAVEMPESEVDSTHYRVLFLAGLVLFLFTFVFNTLAETVRHRLRKKYGSL